MKTVLLLIFLLINIVVNAQNWQTIKSTDTVYFKSLSSYYLTTQIDSVHFVNGDSILYPFKSIRSDNSNSNWSLYSGPSWFGDKIIIQSNGNSIFFNANNDSIFIKPQASLGDTFTVYYYPNSNDSIIATVTNYTQETILGNLDSVKTFTLTSTSSQPNDSITNKVLKIGKQSGFITVIPFYSFPYVYEDLIFNQIQNPNYEYQIIGKENPRTGITKPTYNDIYNVEVGDIIQFGFNGYPCVTHYEYEILSKTFFNSDSVIYEIKRTYWGHCVATGPDMPSYEIPLSIETIPQGNNISNKYVSNQIFEKVDIQSIYVAANNIGRILIGYDGTCGYYNQIHSSFQIGEYDTLNNIYYLSQWQVPQSSKVFIPKAFSYYGQPNNFIARINQAGTCGNRFYLDVENIQKENKLTIYPNPATTQINIKGIYKSLQIYNSIGELVMVIEKPLNSINIEHLPNGLYFIKGIDNNDVEFSAKMVKN